jgi:hypothetical protein
MQEEVEKRTFDLRAGAINRMRHAMSNHAAAGRMSVDVPMDQARAGNDVFGDEWGR